MQDHAEFVVFDAQRGTCICVDGYFGVRRMLGRSTDVGSTDMFCVKTENIPGLKLGQRRVFLEWWNISSSGGEWCARSNSTEGCFDMLRTAPGWWTIRSTFIQRVKHGETTGSQMVVECDVEDACRPKGTHWTRCAEGYNGYLCQACSRGGCATGDYYKTSSGRCVECQTSSAAVPAVFVSVAALAAVAATVYTRRHGRRSPSQKSGTADQATGTKQQSTNKTTSAGGRVGHLMRVAALYTNNAEKLKILVRGGGGASSRSARVAVGAAVVAAAAVGACAGGKFERNIADSSAHS